MADDKTRSDYLAEIDSAPEWAVFDEQYAAAARNVTVFTIRMDRRKGIGIPYEKLGRQCLYRKSAILGYLAGTHRLGAPEARPVEVAA